LGFIKEDAAISLLQINIDEHAYNMLVGRNINLRYDDGSSVTNSLESELYITRANLPVDNHSIRNKINHGKSRLSPFITHETFPNIKIFFKAFPKIKIVLLKRHPIDVVHSWLLRGWGSRYKEIDILAFIPLIKNDEYQFPWYVNGWEKEYYNSTEVERIIKCVNVLMNLEDETYKSLTKDQQKQVLIIHYENLLEQTEKEIHRMERFFNTKASNRMHAIMLRENCPTQISLDKRVNKMNEISKKVSKKYANLLLSKAEDYEFALSL